VIKLRHHGDVLLTTPVFTTLAANGIEADALVYRDTADMLSLNPHVAQVHTIDRAWRNLGAGARVGRYVALVRELARRDYDLIVHLTPHWHGAWLARLLRPHTAVAPAIRRSGRLGDRAWKRSFTHRFPVLPGNRRHTVEMHLDALRAIGIQPSSQDKALAFVPGPDAQAAVAGKLAAHGLSPGGYLAIHPTSRWLFKTWPVARMTELVDALTARGEKIVLTAAPTEAELAWIASLNSRLARPVVDLAGQLTLKELGALIAGARAFVGVDSVPMHMAAALGVPTVVLFGPSGDIEWGPWQVRSRVVTASFPCRPCGQDGCGGSKVSDCLTSITAGSVLAALDDLEGAGAR
jgi:heptosyltransferase-3